MFFFLDNFILVITYSFVIPYEYLRTHHWRIVIISTKVLFLVDENESW